MHWVSDVVQHFLTHWGYWAIVVGLLSENAGIPLPGETVLVSASFLAQKGYLSMYYIIPVAIIAACLGDNAGYWIGTRAGKTLIRWIRRLTHLDDVDIAVTRDLIQRRGATTIFWSRFIFGLRTVAGLMAGMFGMKWRRFLIFNLLGAAAWVTTIALIGYGFGAALDEIVNYFEYASWSISLALLALGYLLWRHHKKQFQRGTQATRQV